MLRRIMRVATSESGKWARRVVLMEQGGKLVHHRCGYGLWVVVLERFNGVTVVSYRDQGPQGLIVSVCPGCGGVLKLWWEMPGQVVATDPQPASPRW